MKKVLLFMLLFAAGLSVLYWIENPVALDPVPVVEEQEEPVAPPVAPAKKKPVVPEPPSQVALPADDQSDPNIGIRVSGSTRYTKRVQEGPYRGRKLYHLESADSRSLESGYVELIDLWAVAYDAESGDEVLRIKASKGRAAVNNLFDEDIALTQVELTLLRNAPIVPLTLRAPDLTGSLSSSHFRTDARVSIQGQGLAASGTGFEFVVAGGMLGFDRDGYAEVEIESGRRATLNCSGAFEIRRPAEPSAPVVLDAHEAATLSLLDEDPVVLRADHLRIAGRSQSGESEVLGFERIDAQGEVALLIAGSEFLSERAAIELAGAESEFRAEMAGAPHGKFLLRRRLAAAKVPGSVAPFSIGFSGVGPLVVTRREQVEFELPGPSRLEWTDARLEAARHVSGRFGPAVDEAEFGAFGDVRIERENGSLLTPEFHLRHRRDSEGASRVTASAAGSARMSGLVDEEHGFLLTSDQRIEFALDGDLWRIPSANGIDLTVDGPRGFVAHAREVLDFSPEPLSLEARGDVSLENEQGAVRGDRLVLRGLDDLQVDGRPDLPAHFRSQRGEWFARHVERVGQRMIAEGVERAKFEDAGGEYELACDRMVVEEREQDSAEENGILEKGFLFVATGSVSGRADYPEDSFKLDCQRLEGERTEHRREGVFLFSQSNLVARDTVTCEFVRSGSEYLLRSDSLTINRTNRGTETLTSGTLIARGNVEVESRNEASLSGRGDELEIDKFGRGELIAFEGRRISAEGEMPGGRFPFSMTARRLQFSDAFLDASWPEIEFRLGKPSSDYQGGMQSRASAERMEARGDSLTLTGGVRVEGISPELKPWVLRSDRARIDVRQTGGAGLLGSLRASGDVEFDLQGTMHAVGEEFMVKSAQRRVRVAGEPARIFYGGLDIETSWIEYDLLIHAISTAKDSVFKPVTAGSTPRKQK